jgi:hypothetical protein
LDSSPTHKLYDLDDIACSENMLRMAVAGYDFPITFHSDAAIGKIQMRDQIHQRNTFREGSVFAV